MRVVTTCTKDSLAAYGHRWLDSREQWQAGTDFQFYTEGFAVDCPGKDFDDLREFSAWKRRHRNYVPPSWRYNVVAYAHKVFAAIDALYDYDGIGVWLDADCVTYKPISDGFVEGLLQGNYLAHFKRPGLYTETGMWIMDCAKPEHRGFLDAWRDMYLTDRFKALQQWTDCHTLDATIRASGISTTDLSGEFGKHMHPMALTEIGKYIDHQKGPRKSMAKSPENKFREAA